MNSGMTVVKTLGEQIKETREKKGYSQSQVEKALHWGRGSMSNYERGVRNIPEERKDQLFEYLGLGANKIEEFFSFKETETPKPVDDKAPSKHGDNRNGEGYLDTTMAQALRNASIKYTEVSPGDIRIFRSKNGATLKKLVLSIRDKSAICITVFTNGSSKDFKIETSAGPQYISYDILGTVKLKELEELYAEVSDKDLNKVKEFLCDIFGIGIEIVEVEKEVIKEVPVEVEKEVIKEVPVPADSNEVNLLKVQLAIYKDMVDRLLPRPRRNWNV